MIAGARDVIVHLRTIFHKSHIPHLTHSPLGSWNVLAMLGALTLQVGLGLFAIDVDGLNSGYLAHFVSYRVGRNAAELHGLVFNLLLALIVLHLAAIVFYSAYKRERLVLAIITGMKRVPVDHRTRLNFVAAWRAIIGLMLASAVAALVARGLPL